MREAMPTTCGVLKTLFKKCLLIGGGIFIGLICSEVGLRLCGFRYATFLQPDRVSGWSHRPDDVAVYSFLGHDTLVKINSHGWRDYERPVKKPPSTFRIAVIGDSFVAAWQVGLQETFCALAERQLNQQAAFGARKVEVLNFGVNGYGTAQELLALQSYIPAYEPDLVILAFFAANDLIDNSKELDFDGRAWMRPYFELRSDLLVLDSSFRDSPKFRSRSNLFFRSWYALRHHSRFIQLVSKMRNRVFLKLGRRIRQAREDVPVKSWQERGLYDQVYLRTPSTEWQETWLITEKIIGQMKKEVSNMDAQFGILQVNAAIQVHHDDVRQQFIKHLGVTDLAYPNRRISALATKLHIPDLDVAPKLRRLADNSHELYHGFSSNKGWGHWNVKGHRVVGNLLANWIHARFGSGEQLTRDNDKTSPPTRSKLGNSTQDVDKTVPESLGPPERKSVVLCP